MDWPNSYFTISDANVESIWTFLKRCHERGWLSEGHRPLPWCTRCGTSISQHEMLDSYVELTHDLSLSVALPLRDRPDHPLLVWTTTPWTLPANVAAAVHPELDYAECALAGAVYYVAAGLAGRHPSLGRAAASRQGRRARGAALRRGPSTTCPSSGGSSTA